MEEILVRDAHQGDCRALAALYTISSDGVA